MQGRRSDGLPAPVLGMRLLALAVVAGSSAFLPVAYPLRVLLVIGILAGTLIGFAQHVTFPRWPRAAATWFVLAQVGVWTYLLHATGGQRSPLFLGFMLEVPLSGAVLARRGCVLAAMLGVIAYLASGAILDPPLDRPRALLAVGFLALTALLTILLLEVFERQRRQIAASQAVITARAENLAEELRLLGDYLSGALIGLDDMGRIASLNRAAIDLLGVDTGACGRAWQEVLRMDGGGTRAVLRTLSEGAPQRAFPLVFERADGRRLDLVGELWVSPSAQGRCTYLLLGLMSTQPGDSDPVRRLGEAVACVSHQIKNSLHALQGFAVEISNEIGDGNGSDSTRHFVRALRSLGQLADDVLAMAGTPRPPGETVLLEEAMSTAVVLARRRGVQIRIDEARPGIGVRANRGQLVHALFNLLDNACQVSPAGTVVVVRVTERDGRVTLEIRDGGPGLPAGFERMDRPVASKNGSGYGLLAARRFLEENGGELAFERPYDGGTVSRVALPAAATTGTLGNGRD